MSPRYAARRLAGSVLCARPVNAALRALLRPFAPLLPIESLMRVPLVGTVCVALPGGASLRLVSRGGDHVASGLDWRGLDGWEPETFRVLEDLWPAAGLFLDVGASTGIFTLRGALANPRCRVFAFEPAPAMVEALRANLALNPVPNVSVIEAAVGDREGVIELNLPRGGRLPFGASSRPGFRSAGLAIRVPALTLDAFVERAALGRVDLVKLDTEGTEPAVLAGARRMLARDLPWIVCEVLHGLTEPGLHEALDPLGYRYFAITRRGLEERPRIVGDPAYRERNWLFAAPPRLERAGAGPWSPPGGPAGPAAR